MSTPAGMDVATRFASSKCPLVLQFHQRGPLGTFFCLFFSVRDPPLRTFPGDHQPPTANCQPLPTATNRQPPPTVNRQPLPTATYRQTPTTNPHQPPIAHHQPPPTVTNHQQPTVNRQPPPTTVEHMSYTQSFLDTSALEQFSFLFFPLRTALSSTHQMVCPTAPTLASCVSTSTRSFFNPPLTFLRPMKAQNGMLCGTMMLMDAIEPMTASGNMPLPPSRMHQSPCCGSLCF